MRSSAVFFTSGNPNSTQADVEQMRRSLGLDQPMYVQLGVYLRDIVNGDLGYSHLTGRPVLQDLLERLPASIELTVAGLGLAFNAKPVVRAAADTSVNVPYLDAVLYLLGIPREDVEQADALAVHLAPDAAGFARREALYEGECIVRLADGIDPVVTECRLHRLIIGEGDQPAVLLASSLRPSIG